LKDYFKEGLEKIKVSYDEDKIEKSLKYLEILLDYNSHTNLTAIREEKAIIEKHFLDSLLLHNLLKEEDKTLIDIGTGAGFPGMMLAIFNEDKKFILLDSVKKKTDFLELVKNELNLKNVEIINGRAEEIIKAREVVNQVYIDEKIEQYIADIVFSSRYPERYGLSELKGMITYGGSPRASINLAKAARAYAFIKHRGYVVPEDVRAIAHDVMRHRIGLSYEAEAANVTSEEIVSKIINQVEVP